MMKRVTKALTASVAIATLGFVGLAPAMAAPEVDTPAPVTAGATEEAQDQLEGLQEDLQKVQVRSFGDFLDGASKLGESLGQISDVLNGLSSAASKFTIIDINSIPLRLDLGAQVIDAITFATTQLTEKVDRTHQMMALAITRAAIQVANPFASNDQIRDAGVQLQAQIEKAKAMPELKLTDRATIYTRARLDKEIWRVRIARDHFILGKVPFRVYHELNRNITKAVGVQLRPSATVQQVKQAIEKLQGAYLTATKALPAEKAAAAQDDFRW